MAGAGVFQWKRRMGVHEAYHRARGNRVVHWVAIPFELGAVVTLLALARVGAVDLALVGLVLVAPIYLATDVLLGALMVGFLAAWRWLALHFLAGMGGPAALGAAVVFAITFAVQVRVGHGVFEEGRDDTRQNLAELRSTKNPIPILLVFYYHLVEIALVLGYRPQLRREIEAVTAQEVAAMAATARRS